MANNCIFVKLFYPLYHLPEVGHMSSRNMYAFIVHKNYFTSMHFVGNVIKYLYIYIYIHGPPKKCIHTLTKENSMLYVSTNFNYTSQVENTLQ